MNVLIIGSGGREHALAYKIKESPTLEKLFILPGNPGTEKLGTNLNLDPENYQEIASFISEHNINLVVIGPEKPLVDGLADFLRQRNIPVFGPDKKAADIEAHKSFAKHLMKKYNIPSADYVEFNAEEFNTAFEACKKLNYPVVIKADGLAAGKGVLICSNLTEALTAVNDIFIKKIFGDAGSKIIIEEFLTGEEASIFAVTDGSSFICLPAAQDHKRIGNNDTGKNTGGMGAYAPAPVVTQELLLEVENKIIIPVLKAMEAEERKFNGCLYCGLMITAEGPKVIEFNCRFGDPETQVVLPLLDGDFLGLLYSAAIGSLNPFLVDYSGGASVCVVAASYGYPDSFEKGFEIEGLDLIHDNVVVFHAGTTNKDGKILTNGGRVLGVTSVIRENDIKKAKLTAYSALKYIHFGNIYFRTDIADKAIDVKK